MTGRDGERTKSIDNHRLSNGPGNELGGTGRYGRVQPSKKSGNEMLDLNTG